MKINYQTLEKKIKINFKDKDLLVRSLTHKSYNKEINNEKLEFLGDRVIGLILSKKLYELYPNETEGILDKRLASLVNRKTCALVAWSIGMQNFIVIGDQKKKITLKDEKILSDACEALIAAVYLDKGYNYVKQFVLRLWKKQIDKSYVTILDSKTKLQEYSLKKYKKLPVYKLLGFKGPKHEPIFKISVSFSDSKAFIGLGSSKKLAEQEAAGSLLKYFGIK